jgi:hypothetical protein
MRANLAHLVAYVQSWVVHDGKKPVHAVTFSPGAEPVVTHSACF